MLPIDQSHGVNVLTAQTVRPLPEPEATEGLRTQESAAEPSWLSGSPADALESGSSSKNSTPQRATGQSAKTHSQEPDCIRLEGTCALAVLSFDRITLWFNGCGSLGA